MSNDKIIVFRKWNSKEIRVRFDQSGVFIESGLDGFKEELLKTVREKLPKLGFNLSSAKIAEIVNLTVENAFNELIDDMKEQTR